MWRKNKWTRRNLGQLRDIMKLTNDLWLIAQRIDRPNTQKAVRAKVDAIEDIVAHLIDQHYGREFLR